MNKLIKNLAGALLFSLFSIGFSAETNAEQRISNAKVVGARDIIKEIIGAVGLTARFEMMEADIDNAAAVIINGKRYILYNTRFLNAVNNASHTDWAAVSILAHEIGHHLNGHTLSRQGSNPADELEADEFSGFVLRKMGATLENAQAAMSVLSDENDSRTHPGRAARLAAISTGWVNANTQLASAKTLNPATTEVKTKSETKAISRSLENPEVKPVETPVLDNKYILTKVVFQKSPKEQFFITTRGNLVRVKNNQVEIIGQLAHTNHPEYPFMFKSNTVAPLFISKTGIIYSQNGKKLGWLSS